jgi:NADPH-dependent glutamate synthase beta subunit-like oxidoreductase/NAD(P)H-flavin reductase
MNLNFTVNFSDLNSLEGLKKIDGIFLDYLEKENDNLYKKLIEYRLIVHSSEFLSFNYSSFLIDVAPYFDDFISELFCIEEENFFLKCRQKDFDIIYECRRKFVQRVFKNYNSHNYQFIDFLKTSQDLSGIIGKITETNFANNVMKWLKENEKFQLELNIAADYAVYLVLNNSSLPLFNIPRTSNSDNLIRENRIKMLEQDIYLGFDYRDKEVSLENALSNAKYCIYCHYQEKDSCRHGLKTQENKIVNGCPLDQKISEMNKILSLGFNIGALGVILIDNPLVAATGHRICNDCMKSCIFQKQDPVNIPLIESVILDNVLNLPYGVEIYILLTKWNPLNIKSPLPKEPTNYNILVTGLGPAGFALTHYLLNEGHNVISIDGLKIRPLYFDIKNPIKSYLKIKQALSKRIPQGFGGVAEYGITNRWDKNNLTLIRLILERRSDHFKMMGGVRLGSNINTEQSFALGFDHIALCLGAGKPKYINLASYFFKGVKSAADFLMNLQQGGAYLENSNINLLLRMPVVVIGCGLTAIDSSVEVIHYYYRQVEKLLSSYENNLVNLDKLSDEDKIIAEEFLFHARLFRKAKSFREKIDIFKNLGGVKICYRNNIEYSPAYKRNHEEIEHAKAIGVEFILNLTPLEIKTDKYEYVNQVDFLDQQKNIVTIPAKTVLVAIGTEDNEFQDIVGFTGDNERFSHFGDCNQKYSGSVVKAIASAKNGYKKITRQLSKYQPNTNYSFLELSEILDKQLKAKIHSIKEISSNVIDLVIKSSLASKNYQIGQIFRLQNLSDNISKTTKPLALSPYEIDPEQGLIYFVILKTGISTKLCSKLKEGEEVVLMGPTGSRSHIPKSQTVILIGEGIRNMALLPIAKELKKQGKKILFFAIYETSKDVFYTNKIKDLADKTYILQYDDKIDEIINDLIAKMKIAKLPLNSYIICYVKNEILIKIKEHGQELFKYHHFISNILAPMQCMMKGICGQCIQKIDDQKGYIFSCSCLEYDINKFDPKLNMTRFKQNSLFESLSQGF